MLETQSESSLSSQSSEEKQPAAKTPIAPKKTTTPFPKSYRVFSKHKVMNNSSSEDTESCIDGKPCSEMQFKVLSYNVLADSYHQIRKMKKICASFPNRFPRIKKELQTSAADLLLLQEVDHQDLYLTFLGDKMGYEVSHVQRRQERDSVLIAFKPEKF